MAAILIRESARQSAGLNPAHLVEGATHMDRQTLQFTLKERERSLRRVETRIEQLEKIRSDLTREILELSVQIAERNRAATITSFRLLPNDRGV